jgi:polyhydroxybutyrate depolymerase
LLRLEKLTCALVVFWAASAAAASSTETIRVSGVERSYILHMPSASKGPLPVIVALHGGGSNAEAMERYSRLSDTADARDFIVAYPEGSGRVTGIHTWNAGNCCAFAQRNGVDDVAFIAAVIDDVVSHHGGDASRVLVTGMSNGAMMAYRFAAREPGRVAAVAGVAGSVEFDASDILGPVPVLHFHGTEDHHVPVKGGVGSKSLTRSSFNSLDHTVRAWLAANKANPIPRLIPVPDLADDGMTTIRQEYVASETRSPIVVYLITGGGHTWPGSSRAERLLGSSTMDFDANEVMWEFLMRVTNQE